jgi:hypothetical protein
MNVIERFQTGIAEGEPLDWEKMRIEIDVEHARAQTLQERDNLLALYTVMMDIVERTEFTPQTKAGFVDDRRRGYHRMLLREACVDGCLCDQTLYDVTAREIMNGRMLQDDPIRAAAVAAVSRLEQAATATTLPPDAGRPTVGWRRLLVHLTALSHRVGAT